MAGEERGEGILEVLAECRGDRTGERPREGATLGKRVGEGGGSCGMMGNLERVIVEREQRDNFGVATGSSQVVVLEWRAQRGSAGLEDVGRAELAAVRW